MSNLSTLYNDLLPGVFRREDEEAEFLKRFLTPFCDELDRVDAAIDTTSERLNPDTAPEDWIEFWLWSLFGWSFVPSWFTVEQKRELYRTIATHYARRGTRRGIEGFLRTFGIESRVHAEPLFMGETYCGSGGWMIDGPLGMIVEVAPRGGAQGGDQSYCGEAFCGEAITAQGRVTGDTVEVETLLRFQAPVNQVVIVAR